MKEGKNEAISKLLCRGRCLLNPILKEGLYWGA